MGGSLAAALATVFLVPYAENNGYLKAAIIVAVVSFLAMSLISLFGKERYKVKEEVLEKPASLRDTWEYLIHNKYLLYFYAYRMISGSIAVSMLHLCCKILPWRCEIYVDGRCHFSHSNLHFVPVLRQDFQADLIRFGRLSLLHDRNDSDECDHSVRQGYQNRTLAIACLVVIAVLAILPSIFKGAIPQDCVEYGTYKTETRKEGITFALQTFANKLTAAVATIITGGVLTFVGYDVAAEKAATEAHKVVEIAVSRRRSAGCGRRALSSRSSASCLRSASCLLII